MSRFPLLGLAILCVMGAIPANAQDTTTSPQADTTQQAAATPDAAAADESEQEQPSLKVYFQTGSAQITSEQAAVLDQASRLFRDGNPVVMIISGISDTTGSADRNLRLSTLRAQAVADGLTSRGIPAERLQVVGKGNSELEIATEDGVANPENRIAEITWR